MKLAFGVLQIRHRDGRHRARLGDIVRPRVRRRPFESARLASRSSFAIPPPRARSPLARRPTPSPTLARVPRASIESRARARALAPRPSPPTSTPRALSHPRAPALSPAPVATPATPSTSPLVFSSAPPSSSPRSRRRRTPRARRRRRPENVRSIHPRIHGRGRRARARAPPRTRRRRPRRDLLPRARFPRSRTRRRAATTPWARDVVWRVSHGCDRRMASGFGARTARVDARRSGASSPRCDEPTRTRASARGRPERRPRALTDRARGTRASRARGLTMRTNDGDDDGDRRRPRPFPRPRSA